MVGENLSQYGAVALGLGTGLGEVELHVADTSLGGEPVAMAIAQVGGLGSGGGVSAATAELLDNNATLPDFQPVPEMASFDPLTHEFELTSDERSRFVRVIITGADRSKRMVLMDSGDQAGHLADYGGSMGYGQTTWEVLSFETTTDTFGGADSVRYHDSGTSCAHVDHVCTSLQNHRCVGVGRINVRRRPPRTPDF